MKEGRYEKVDGGEFACVLCLGMSSAFFSSLLSFCLRKRETKKEGGS